MRNDKPAAFELARAASLTPFGSGKSAQAKVKAFLCMNIFCGAIAPFSPDKIVQVALTPMELVELVTFWNAPLKIG